MSEELPDHIKKDALKFANSDAVQSDTFTDSRATAREAALKGFTAGYNRCAEAWRFILSLAEDLSKNLEMREMLILYK